MEKTAVCPQCNYLHSEKAICKCGKLASFESDCYAVPSVVEDLWREIECSGRRTDVLALRRLVRYWTRRTRLTAEGVCYLMTYDVRRGWPIGLSKYGFS